jgi:outer membrane protein assembly factor BamB
VAPPTITFDARQLAAYAAPTVLAPTRRGCGIVAVAIVAPIVIMVAVGVVLLGRTISENGGISGITGDDGLDLSSFTSASIVRSDDETGPDLAVMGSAGDGQRLFYLDFDADEPVRWSFGVDAESANLYDEYVAGPELLYVTVDSRVVAFNRRSGAEAFAIDLVDVVQTTICADCIQLLGADRNTLVTLSADGTLAGWNATDGTARWSVRLTEATRQILDIGGNPGVIDQLPGEDPKVFVYDAATGAMVATMAPSCPDATFGGLQPLGISDYLQPVGDGGFVWAPDHPLAGCVQRWDAGGTQPTWTTLRPEGGTNIPYDPENFVVGDGRVAVVQDDTVLTYDLATGAESRFVVAETDMLPVGMAQGVIVLQAESTRGTTRTSLLAIDLVAGNTKWTFEPEGDPYEEFDMLFVTEPGWTASIVGDAVAVVQYRDEPSSLVYQQIPLGSGTATTPAVTPLGSDTFADRPSFFGFSGDTFVLAIGHEVRVVDARTGEVQATAP